MNCVLIAKMDQVLSLKNTGKVGEFCQCGKVGTMFTVLTIFVVAAVTMLKPSVRIPIN